MRTDHLNAAPRCTAKNGSGNRCGSPAMFGEALCRNHGITGYTARRSLVKRAVAGWTPDEHVDPYEVLRTMIDVTEHRHGQLVSMIQFLTDEMDPDTEPGSDTALRRQIEALVGVVARKSDGDDGEVIGEYRRELVKAEAEERERATKFAAIALQAGLEERRTRIMEAEARVLVAMFDRFAAGLGLTPEQYGRVPAVAERVLRLAASGEIAGETA
jgi:hypothetical protein